MPDKPYFGDSYQEQFVNWMKTPNVGCVFARSFAKRNDVGGLQGVTIAGSNVGIDEILSLSALLAQAYKNAEGVYVVFPDISSLAAIIGLVQRLCQTPRWTCVEVTGECSRAGDALLLGLRWRLPDEKHINYVLGFANLPHMPRTRRAPYTALILRTGPTGRAPGIAYTYGASPKADRRLREPSPIPVHLADMPDLLAVEAHVADVWRQTTKLKQNQLEGDPMAEAAKAKVTFCLPIDARDALRDVITDKVVLGLATMP